MRIAAVGLCAVLAAGTAQGATFYYVSAPYTVSNYDTDTPPVVTTGVLDIDEAKVPGGLANNEVSWSIFQSSGGREIPWSEAHPAVRSLTFTNGIMDFGRIESTYSSEAYFRFDANGEIANAGGMIGDFVGEGLSDNLYTFSGGQETYEGPGRRGGHWSRGDEGGFRALWTTDAAQWARQIVKRVTHALSNPPSNACRVATLDVGDFPLA
jgi:hypothetical protein